MKKLTCKDLGGPCDYEIVGATFEEVGQKSHAHVMEQISKGDEAHKMAVQKMKDRTPEEQQAMMIEFRKKFDEAEEV